MSFSFDILWLSASPSLKHFDLPLLRFLCRDRVVAQWEYCQSLDEASSLEATVRLLDEFLQQRDRPVHLAGHGMGGVVALSYAQQFPQRLRSLSLLAVAAQPAATWQAHYYVQRQLMSCSQAQILANTVRTLFGNQPPYAVKDLVRALHRDLVEPPSPHSLFKLVSLPKADVVMPLLVCGCQTDAIVNPSSLNEWNSLLKPTDQLWQCPQGKHFFHYYHPEAVGNQLLSFWQNLESAQSASSIAHPTPHCA